MSVLKFKDNSRTVANIAARDALVPKIDGMDVTVEDASADPNVGSGRAVYKYVKESNSWLLLTNSKSHYSADDISGLSDVAKTGSYNDLKDKPDFSKVNYFLPNGGMLTVDGNFRTKHLLLGDSLNHPNIANVWTAGTGSGQQADRPLNFIDTSAVMKIVRVGGNPALELQEWDSNITNQVAYWDIVSVSGVLQFRDRKNNASNVRLQIDQATGAISGTNLSGNNTGDETQASIIAKLGYTPVSNAFTVNGHRLNNSVSLTAADIGLDSVNNTSDLNKPVSTAQAAADTAILNSAKAYADGLVVGLWDDRGNYNASTNVFPSTGGSGPSGSILKGDIWTVSVAGSLDGTPVAIRQTVRAMVDNPGQTVANWSIGLSNLDIDNSLTAGVTGRAPSQDAVLVALANEVIARDAAIAEVATGINTGDETATTIRTKLGITTLSGSNTGDETAASIKTKLGFTPYDSANPSGFQTATQVANAITAANIPNIIYGTFANRPAAGVVNRLYVTTDTEALYRDTGSAWILISGAIAQLLTGSVATFSGTTVVALTATPTTSLGTLIWTQAITTTPGATKINIRFPAMIDASLSGCSVMLFLFRGTTLVGIAVCEIASTGKPGGIHLDVWDTIPAQGTYTYTCRAAISASGTWYLNQDKSGNKFGGNTNSQYSLTEYF